MLNYSNVVFDYEPYPIGVAPEIFEPRYLSKALRDLSGDAAVRSHAETRQQILAFRVEQWLSLPKVAENLLRVAGIA